MGAVANTVGAGGAPGGAAASACGAAPGSGMRATRPMMMAVASRASVSARAGSSAQVSAEAPAPGKDSIAATRAARGLKVGMKGPADRFDGVARRLGPVNATHAATDAIAPDPFHLGA